MAAVDAGLIRPRRLHIELTLRLLISCIATPSTDGLLLCGRHRVGGIFVYSVSQYPAFAFAPSTPPAFASPSPVLISVGYFDCINQLLSAPVNVHLLLIILFFLKYARVCSACPSRAIGRAVAALEHLLADQPM